MFVTAGITRYRTIKAKSIFTEVASLLINNEFGEFLPRFLKRK